MNATRNDSRKPGTALTRGIGLHGRVAVFWAMAGGIGLGGFLVAAMTLAGRLSGHALFLTSSGLFVVGAVLGLLHGAVLGYLGRTLDTPRAEALRGLVLSALYAVPGLAVAWLIAVWLGMSMVASYIGQVGPWIGVGAAWAAGFAVAATAAWYGARALRNAYARWPERRLGTALTAAVFAALLVTFLADRPELWGLRVRLTDTGAVLLAATATLWLAGPLVTLALRLVKRLPEPVRIFHRGRRAMVDGALGLVVGLLVGLLVVPFDPTGSVLLASTGERLVAAVSQALVDEVLLRLFLVTAVAWLLLRWHRVDEHEAAVLAVGTGALVQVLLYLPGVVAVGFPTTLAAVGFTLAAVLIPAVVFGALYWIRGFGTALLAHAVALVSVALVAL